MFLAHFHEHFSPKVTCKPKPISPRPNTQRRSFSLLPLPLHTRRLRTRPTLAQPPSLTKTDARPPGCSPPPAAWPRRTAPPPDRTSPPAAQARTSAPPLGHPPRRRHPRLHTVGRLPCVHAAGRLYMSPRRWPPSLRVRDAGSLQHPLQQAGRSCLHDAGASWVSRPHVVGALPMDTRYCCSLSISELDSSFGN